MKVYLAKKDGKIISHTDLDAMQQLDGVSTPEKTVTVEEWEATGSTAYINAAGEIILGIPAEEAAVKQEIESLTAEEASLQAELASKDYKVIKASETGNVLAELEPALHERREECRSRINEIRDRLAELGEETAA